MRKSRDQYFMEMLPLVTARSTCARRSVGAIITDVEGVVLSMGYNGPPRRWDHCTEHPCRGAADPPGDTRRCAAVHAEQNALLQCWRLDLAHTIYVSAVPCYVCAKLILQASLSRVVVAEPYQGDDLGRWALYEEGKLFLYDYESGKVSIFPDAVA